MKKIGAIIGIVFLFISCAKEKGEIFDIEVKRTIKLEGLKSRVEVVRDNWGVVHIYASNEEDLFFVQGYIQAHDRLLQMLLMRGLAEGSLSELNGPSTLPLDVTMRLFNLMGVADEIYNGASEDERKLLRAYSNGVNAFLKNARPDEIPFELLFLGITDLSVIRKWTPQDTLAFARLMTFNLSFDDESAWGLLYQNTKELLAQKYPQNLIGGMLLDMFALNPKFPLVSLPARLVYIDTPNPPSMQSGSVIEASYSTKIKNLPVMREIRNAMKSALGDKPFSNNWAISPSYSETGNPLLANDPHLNLTQPSVFHEEHLNTKKKGGEINVGGVIFPGTPGIVIGFNENIAWGETTVGYDVTDFYLEALSTTVKPWKVLRNGKWIEVEERNEFIPFLGEGTDCSIPQQIIDAIKEYPVDIGAPFFREEEKICLLPVTIYEVPEHGPVVGTLFDESPPLLVSVRWTGFEPTNELSTFLGFMKARNINDAKEAVKNFRVGAQNHLIIDRDGNIGWFPNANLPKRDLLACADPHLNPLPPHTLPPFLPLPGDGRCDWKGYIDIESGLPSLENPDDGFIVTANNAPTGSTYPYIGAFFDVGYRAYRIVSRIRDKIGNKGSLNLDDMKEIQADVHSNTCEDFLDLLLNALKDNEDKLTKEGKEALSYLDNWDCETSSGFIYDPADQVNPLKRSSDETEIKRAIATTIYHTWYSNFVHDTFDDQVSGELPSDFYARAIYHITFRPNCLAVNYSEPCQLTGDGESGYSPFWDDINTSEEETRDDIILKAFKEAIEGLKKWSTFKSVSQWLWGRYHTLTLKHLICMTGDCPPEISILNVPSPFDPVFGSGFPRGGEQFAVDSSNPGLSKMDAEKKRDFTYSSGPSYRIVVEMTDNGPIAYTAIPGGNVANPASNHYSDQIMKLWWRNDYKKFAFTEEEIKKNAEELLVFLPE